MTSVLALAVVYILEGIYDMKKKIISSLDEILQKLVLTWKSYIS